MLGFLKKKLSQAIESISKKAKAKEEIAEEVKKPEIREEIKEALPKPQEEYKIDVVPKLETVEAEVIVEKTEKKGVFKKLAETVVKKLTERKLAAEDIEPVLQELETGLIEADVAVEVAEKIVDDLKAAVVDKEIKRGKERAVVVEALKKSLLEILSVPEVDLQTMIKTKKPTVMLFLGFNGSGKTTSIAKIGKWLMDEGHAVVFAAGDTWRKAAIEQLEEHGKKLKVNVIKHKYGADPAAVIYDGIEHSKAKRIDVLLADSAGRTHVNQNLIDELKKIVRVAKPDLKILVMDSLIGNDAVVQSKMFNDAVGVDAVVFTKLDVNQKGGAILSVAHSLKKPILFLGTGQEYSDLTKFDREKFVDQLLSG